MKAMKVTISGTYRKHDGEVIDFEALKGVVPFNDFDLLKMHIQDRYAEMWIRTDPKKFKERMESIRTVRIDEYEEADFDFTFLGKDVKEMTQAELQDLATLKDLRVIPVFRFMEDREARERAYCAYSNAMKGTKLDWRKEGFSDGFTRMPALVVDDEAPRRDKTIRLTNDQVIKAEQESDDARTGPKATLGLDQLMQIADEQKISYPKDISRDDLYRLIYT